MPLLDDETLTAATAQRQHLAARTTGDVETIATHLLGLQAQEPYEAFVGLWSRLGGFATADLTAAMDERRVARTHTMRRTVHLHTRADALALRAIHDEMLRRRTADIVRQVRGADGVTIPVDLDVLERLARPPLDAAPRQLADLGREIAEPFAPAPPRSLGDAAIGVVPLVQVPPRGTWGRRGPAAYTTYGAWWGEEPLALGETDALAERSGVVLRYLAAYGPAATADVRAWSGASGFPEAVAALGDRVQRYRDERGRVLLDVGGREVLDPSLPNRAADLPVRFLPAFDNAVLGYHDRSRVIDDEHKPLSVGGARYVLVAGRATATWTAPLGGLTEDPVTVEVTPLRRLTRGERAAVREEGHALATFLGGRAGRVTFD
ncbi:hypothetical protein C8046_11120 [Serinibacter arcticus]|uniref:Winged helix DNA-binding domain-containing protein n=1 Tax=Serinibacter arcticus TaxID=1655435 RepID=A0A2U1ZZW0_9MICO|nr:hypothetical protein C8046_11120 [Serinibacter arcticus]